MADMRYFDESTSSWKGWGGTGAPNVSLRDTAPSGTTAQRDAAYPNPTGGETWNNTDTGRREFFNGATGQWEPDQLLIGGGSVVYGLARKGEAIQAATQYAGFRVDVPGTGTWSATFVDGGTVSFTPTAGEQFPWHVSSVTPASGGSGIGYLP